MTEPQKAEVLRREGVSLLADRKHDEAIAKLLEAVKLDPQSAEAHRCLGQAWSYMAAELPPGEEKNRLLVLAEQSVRKARELLGEETVAILHDLAWIYDEQGHYEEAIGLYRRGLNVGGPESPQNDLTPIRYNLACSLAKRNRIQEAAAELKLILAEPWRKGELWKWAPKDADLKALRDSPEWSAIAALIGERASDPESRSN